MTIAIVTDSTADLPQELVQQLGIHVVPCTINFDGQVFLDGVDIGHDEFYRRLQASPAIPTTSQPPVGEFLRVYQELHEADHEVVSIHISSRLSAAVDSARQAKSALSDDARIDIVDSQLTSMGLGLLALQAARLAQEGATRQQIIEQVERCREKTHVFCLLDTLEYVRHGGRVGRAQAFLASTLQIKPILTVKDGETHPVARPRTRQKAIDELAALVEGLAPFEEVCVLHSTSPEDAEALGLRIGASTGARVISSRFSAVMGTHLGPRALGAALTRKG